MSVHHLLLGLAGHVDDDLLDWSRELVATGDADRAVELVTAALTADRVALPADVRAELVDTARTTRSVLDPESALPPSGEDGTAHRFASPRAGSGTARIAATVRTLLDGRGRAHLAARHTPAGGAPGPLPRAVVLVEVAEVVDVDGVAGGAPLAHRLGTALVEAGVPASVEVLTAGSAPSAYHAAALRAAWPLGDAVAVEEAAREIERSAPGNAPGAADPVRPGPAEPSPNGPDGGAADAPEAPPTADASAGAADPADGGDRRLPLRGEAAVLPRRAPGTGHVPAIGTPRAAAPGATDLFTPASPDEPPRAGRIPLAGLTRLRISGPAGDDGRNGLGEDAPAGGESRLTDGSAVEGQTLGGGPDSALPEGGDGAPDDPRADDVTTDAPDGDAASPPPRLDPLRDPLPRRGSGIEGAHRLVEHEDDERSWWTPADEGAPGHAGSLFSTDDGPADGPAQTRSRRALIMPPLTMVDGTPRAAGPAPDDAGPLGHLFASGAASRRPTEGPGAGAEHGRSLAHPLNDPLNDPLPPHVAAHDADRGADPLAAVGADPFDASPMGADPPAVEDPAGPRADLAPFPPRLGGPRRVGGRRRLREPAPERDGAGTPPEVGATPDVEGGPPSRHSLGPLLGDAPRPAALMPHPPGLPLGDGAPPSVSFGAPAPQPLSDAGEIHPGTPGPASALPQPHPGGSRAGATNGGSPTSDLPKPHPTGHLDTGRPRPLPGPAMPVSPQDRPPRPASAGGPRLASVNGAPRTTAQNGSHAPTPEADAGTGPRPQPADGRPVADQRQATGPDGPLVSRPSPEPRGGRPPRPSPHPAPQPGSTPAPAGTPGDDRVRPAPRPSQRRASTGPQSPQDASVLDPRLGLSLEALERMSPTDRALLAQLQSELGLRPPGRGRTSPLPSQPLPPRQVPTDPPDIAG
ncbi:hypothetical protein [Pseudonocardia sp.]|uniref:hypothetical protein n=1 Tax=Pseudonocardia sp. TaxID=60912 RepID=UPI003D0C4BF7